MINTIIQSLQQRLEQYNNVKITIPMVYVRDLNGNNLEAITMVEAQARYNLPFFEQKKLEGGVVVRLDEISLVKKNLTL
jgi:hypothetical protein